MPEEDETGHFWCAWCEDQGRRTVAIFGLTKRYPSGNGHGPFAQVEVRPACLGHLTGMLAHFLQRARSEDQVAAGLEMGVATMPALVEWIDGQQAGAEAQDAEAALREANDILDDSMGDGEMGGAGMADVDLG